MAGRMAADMTECEEDAGGRAKNAESVANPLFLAFRGNSSGDFLSTEHESW